MGEQFDRLVALDATYVMQTYARKPVLFVSGRGMLLYDDEGHEYLDFVAGIGAVNLGHGHGAVNQAVASQLAKVGHVSNLFYVEHRAELAQRLVGVAGMGPSKVFFANSGTEAIEGAIKLVRRWGTSTKGEDCTDIVTALRGFHGRTLGALAATGQPDKQAAFTPLLPGFSHVPLNDIAALEAAVTPTTCAVILEPIQGEGGVYPCDTAYLTHVRRLCDERGVLLGLDEVQTGFCRTGTFFAHERYDVTPDVMTVAKGIGNGLPIGALIARDDVAEVLHAGDHGSTFGGGPVVCAAALAVIDALESEALAANAEASGSYLREQLRLLGERTGAVADIRGLGLMNAVEFREPIAATLCNSALERGLVLNNIGTNIVRFLPPLVCGPGEIDTLVGILNELIDGHQHA